MYPPKAFNRRTGSRNSTVVAPQALLMMNAGVVMDSAERLAAKLLAVPSADDSERIRQAFLAAYSRAPEPRETERALAYLGALQREVGAKNSGDEASRKQAWSLYCQTLMGANEFIYLR